jgi:hypothetical protein
LEPQLNLYQPEIYNKNSLDFSCYIKRHAQRQKSLSVLNMPSTLQKTRKQISKKRNGVMNALHEKSRDSLRLHKASVRDQRLDRLAAARSKNEQPIGTLSLHRKYTKSGSFFSNYAFLTRWTFAIVKRVNFFQEALRDSKAEVLELTTIQDKIQA